MKSILELNNDFHNTSVKVRAEVLNHGTHCETSLTCFQKQRTRNKLCGISGCKCGGLRGPQRFRGKKLIVNVFPL